MGGTYLRSRGSLKVVGGGGVSLEGLATGESLRSLGEAGLAPLTILRVRGYSLLNALRGQKGVPLKDLNGGGETLKFPEGWRPLRSKGGGVLQGPWGGRRCPRAFHKILHSLKVLGGGHPDLGGGLPLLKLVLGSP